MKYTDQAQFELKVKTSPHATAMIEDMKENVELWMRIFKDDPENMSGWGHHYFCEDDGGNLIFDINKPNSHVCTICKKEYRGGVYDAAWVYIYRYFAFMSAFEAAAIYRLNREEKYLAHSKRILSFYGDNYKAFAEHGKGPTTSGNGKIMPQALNEAIMIVRVMNTLELLKDDLDKKYISCLSESFLKPAAFFIDDQKKIIHNIPCWINAGVAAVGLFTGDEDLIYRAFDSEVGFENQVKKGVTKDFFWYEGSIHYNCFTIEAFINTLLFAELYGKNVSQEVHNIVKNMFKSVYKYAFDNYMLPNPNDGWPNISLKTYTFIFEIARKVFRDKEFEYMLQNIYKADTIRHDVPMAAPYYFGDLSLEWLLFGEEKYEEGKLGFDTGTYNFSTSNFAILKNVKLNAFIKYGHRGPSHAHADKMNLEIVAFSEIITRDISNCGYPAKLCNEYHRQSISHNTVVVDGMSHASTEEGRTVCFHREEPSIVVAADEVYQNVNFVRDVKMNDNKLIDSFIVNSSEEHTYDWFFHVEGELATDYRTAYAASEGDLGFATNGYQHLKEVCLLEPSDKYVFTWKLRGGITGTQIIDGMNAKVYICKSFDNPVSYFRQTVIVRRVSLNAGFSQEWSFIK